MKNLIETIIADPLFLENVAWKRRHFQIDETIIQAGDKGTELYCVEAGELRVNVQIPLEDRRNLQQGLSDLKTGDIFGEICLHSAVVRTASVKALTDGSLLVINGDQLMQYLDAHPATGYAFFKGLFEIYLNRLDLANNRIGSLFAWGLKAHGIDKHL